MKTLEERNRILNEVKDSCYLAFFDGNPEEGGKEILTGRTKIEFPTAVNGYVKSLNQIEVTGGSDNIVAYGETTQNVYNGYQMMKKQGMATPFTDTGYWAGPNITQTPLENGWARFTVARTSYNNFFLANAAVHNLAASKTYTIIIEYRNSTNDGKDCVLFQGHSSESFDMSTIRKIAGDWVAEGEAASRAYLKFYREYGVGVMVVNTKSSLSTYALRPFATANSTNWQIGDSFELRVSYIEGDHSSDWQNYCGDNYEQFAGGSPSPNPDFTQDITNLKIGNMELRKIGDYADNVYIENGKWYKHSEIAVYDVKSIISNNWVMKNPATGYTSFEPSNAYLPGGKKGASPVLSKYFIHSARDNVSQEPKVHCCTFYGSSGFKFFVNESLASSPAEWIDWLDSLPDFNMYYILDTAVDEEITDMTTITALEAMFGNATGIAKFWGIYDSAVGGKLLYYYIMPYDVNIVKGSTIKINAGNCVLKEG